MKQNLKELKQWEKDYEMLFPYICMQEETPQSISEKTLLNRAKYLISATIQTLENKQ